jgi:hypothetical protein
MEVDPKRLSGRDRGTNICTFDFKAFDEASKKTDGGTRQSASALCIRRQ